MHSVCALPWRMDSTTVLSRWERCFRVSSAWYGDEISLLRRSTIEVHPTFSEAPRVRSSIPHPRTDFSKNQIASWRIISWSESRKRFVSKSRFNRSDDLASKNPVCQKQNSGNVLPLSIVERLRYTGVDCRSSGGQVWRRHISAARKISPMKQRALRQVPN